MLNSILYCCCLFLFCLHANAGDDFACKQPIDFAFIRIEQLHTAVDAVLRKEAESEQQNNIMGGGKRATKKHLLQFDTKQAADDEESDDSTPVATKEINIDLGATYFSMCNNPAMTSNLLCKDLSKTLHTVFESGRVNLSVGADIDQQDNQKILQFDSLSQTTVYFQFGLMVNQF